MWQLNNKILYLSYLLSDNLIIIQNFDSANCQNNLNEKQLKISSRIHLYQ